MPRPTALTLEKTWLGPNSSSTFLSPNYPAPYPGNLSLAYTLRAPIGHRIHVIFRHFRLRASEGCSDVVEVSDVSLGSENPRRLARLCGGEAAEQDIASELNSVRIDFAAGATWTQGRWRRSTDEERLIGFNVTLLVTAGEI